MSYDVLVACNIVASLFTSSRNKEDGYFITSELLKKIASTDEGVKAICKLPALVKRLHALVEELKRKAVALSSLSRWTGCYRLVQRTSAFDDTILPGLH